MNPALIQPRIEHWIQAAVAIAHDIMRLNTVLMLRSKSLYSVALIFTSPTYSTLKYVIARVSMMKFSHYFYLNHLRFMCILVDDDYNSHPITTVTKYLAGFELGSYKINGG